jgi:hypothetical protein
VALQVLAGTVLETCPLLCFLQYPSQVSLGILVELGSEAKILFDLGGGAFMRVSLYVLHDQ